MSPGQARLGQDWSGGIGLKGGNSKENNKNASWPGQQLCACAEPPTWQCVHFGSIFRSVEQKLCPVVMQFQVQVQFPTSSSQIANREESEIKASIWLTDWRSRWPKWVTSWLPDTRLDCAPCPRLQPRPQTSTGNGKREWVGNGPLYVEWKWAHTWALDTTEWEANHRQTERPTDTQPRRSGHTFVMEAMPTEFQNTIEGRKLALQYRNIF